MKISHYILTFCILALLVACEKKSSTSTVTYDTTNAYISSFAFMAVDSVPGLAAAKFVVENLNDTGRIRLADGDSIAFGTRIDNVIPVIKYGGLPSAVICYLGDSSILLTNHDTLDFTLTPIKLQVYAADKKHEKWYYVSAPVHKADPYLYVWEQMTAAAVPALAAEQKGMKTADSFYLFRSTAAGTRVAVSSDGRAWTDNNTNLPAYCHCSQIQYDQAGKVFYYLSCSDNMLYSSADAIVWQTTAITGNGHSPLALWMCYDGGLWTLLQSDTDKDSCYISTINLQTNTFDIEYRLDAKQAPVSDFASVTYKAGNGLDHALIAGGYNADGKMIADTWAFEAANGQHRIVNLIRNKSEKKPFAGASIVRYDNKLLLYGGVNNDHEFISDVLVSENEGMSLSKMSDNYHHPLPDGIGNRWRWSAIADGNYIYLIGGQDNEAFFTDIYRGKLNSIDW